MAKREATERSDEESGPNVATQAKTAEKEIDAAQTAVQAELEAYGDDVQPGDRRREALQEAERTLAQARHALRVLGQYV